MQKVNTMTHDAFTSLKVDIANRVIHMKDPLYHEKATYRGFWRFSAFEVARAKPLSVHNPDGSTWGTIGPEKVRDPFYAYPSAVCTVRGEA